MSIQHTMHRLTCITCFVFAIASLGSDAAGYGDVPLLPAPVKHQLRITLHPDRQSFEAEDRITVPERLGRRFSFIMHQGLNPVSPTPRVAVARISETPGEVPLCTYQVSLPENLRTWSLNYRGTIHHPLVLHEREKARGSQSTAGTVSPDGVFLSGGSYWYPQFDEDLLTFDLEVTLPDNWDAVSQGERTMHEVRDGSRHVRWHCAHPQEEISLVAGPFFQFSRPAGPAQAMVFLHEREEALADRYLDATARYLTLYDKLIGPYPYSKFALVENFWETGYGMPSFALMGPKVIRFPFIIFSSYPHEILHNWWGNGVYPDLKTGNWCEGLTAYMADHLFSEQRGTATEYRRDTLQRYSDYVSKDNDFPLSRFQSRHSAATQAIGYGKAMMFFHMLRMHLGDVAFREGLRDFYRTNVFHVASYDGIRKSLETASGKDLSREFAQWVTRAEAPQLKVSASRVRREQDRYMVSVLLEQTQPGKPFRLDIPVAVTMKDQEHALQTRVRMNGTQQEFQFTLPHAPLRMDVDPEFDVFRRLAPDEVPPALSQVFGAKRLTIVIPDKANPILRKAFADLARKWHESGPEVVDLCTDGQIKSLPSDRSMVILGWENRFSGELKEGLARHQVAIARDSVTVADRLFPRKGLSVVFTVRNPKNPDTVMTWIVTDAVEAVPGLGRKVPHYGAYSILVFQGSEPSNVLKGQWPVLVSPLTVFVPQPDGSIVRVPRGTLAPRKPLAVLPEAASR